MCQSRQAEALPSCRRTSDPADEGRLGLQLGAHPWLGYHQICKAAGFFLVQNFAFLLFYSSLQNFRHNPQNRNERAKAVKQRGTQTPYPLSRGKRSTQLPREVFCRPIVLAWQLCSPAHLSSSSVCLVVRCYEVAHEAGKAVKEMLEPSQNLGSKELKEISNLMSILIINLELFPECGLACQKHGYHFSS